LYSVFVTNKRIYIYIVNDRHTEYSASYGSSVCLCSSSCSLTGRSWRSCVIRQSWKLTVAMSLERPRNQSLEQAEERLKWLKRKEQPMLKAKRGSIRMRSRKPCRKVREQVSKARQDCHRRRSTLWKPWSTSSSVSLYAGCQGPATLCTRNSR